MQSEKPVTLKEVQDAIHDLEKRRKEGKESNDAMYKLKKEALKVAEDMVKKGSNIW